MLPFVPYHFKLLLRISLLLSFKYSLGGFSIKNFFSLYTPNPTVRLACVGPTHKSLFAQVVFAYTTGKQKLFRNAYKIISNLGIIKRCIKIFYGRAKGKKKNLFKVIIYHKLYTNTLKTLEAKYMDIPQTFFHCLLFTIIFNRKTFLWTKLTVFSSSCNARFKSRTQHKEDKQKEWKKRLINWRKKTASCTWYFMKIYDSIGNFLWKAM